MKNNDIYLSLKEKLEKLELEELRFKVKYLPCIEDTLKNPIEKWLQKEANTVLYFNKYENDITIIVKVIDDVLDDFEVIKDNYDYVNSLRRGILLYSKS